MCFYRLAGKTDNGKYRDPSRSTSLRVRMTTLELAWVFRMRTKRQRQQQIPAGVTTRRTGNGNSRSLRDDKQKRQTQIPLRLTTRRTGNGNSRSLRDCNKKNKQRQQKIPAG
jgi:hypothetical protein